MTGGTTCDVGDIPGMDRRACLRPSSQATLPFLVVPADTLTLARVLYRRTKRLAGVRRRGRDPEWRVEPSFHFGFMSTGYAWTTGDIDIRRYLDPGSRRSRQPAPSGERSGTETPPGS
jgi:hypothetical protein